MKKDEIIYNIVVGILMCAIVYLLCCLPMKAVYNEKQLTDSTMKVTYHSIIPFVKVDTVVKAPVIIYGEVIENSKVFRNDGNYEYTTITKVKGHTYVYKSKHAYEYILMNAYDNKFKCIEKFWPSHYIQTIPKQDGEY